MIRWLLCIGDGVPQGRLSGARAGSCRMKAAAVLLLALACCAHARPAQSDVESSVDDVHPVEPAHPRMEESETVEWVEERVEDAADAEHLERERRSPRGWQPGRSSRGWQPSRSWQPSRGFQSGGGGNGGGGFPQPGPRGQEEPRGAVSGGVHREKGVGTIVHAQGHGNVWTSKDGRSRVDAHGEWSRVVRGPARGRPSYNVGATFEHRF